MSWKALTCECAENILGTIKLSNSERCKLRCNNKLVLSKPSTILMKRTNGNAAVKTWNEIIIHELYAFHFTLECVSHFYLGRVSWILLITTQPNEKQDILVNILWLIS